jgi:hypothetical protein
MASDRTSIKEAYRLFDIVANGRRLLTEEERKRFHEHVRRTRKKNKNKKSSKRRA